MNEALLAEEPFVSKPSAEEYLIDKKDEDKVVHLEEEVKRLKVEAKHLREENKRLSSSNRKLIAKGERIIRAVLYSEIEEEQK